MSTFTDEEDKFVTFRVTEIDFHTRARQTLETKDPDEATRVFQHAISLFLRDNHNGWVELSDDTMQLALVTFRPDPCGPGPRSLLEEPDLRGDLRSVIRRNYRRMP